MALGNVASHGCWGSFEPGWCEGFPKQLSPFVAFQEDVFAYQSILADVYVLHLGFGALFKKSVGEEPLSVVDPRAGATVHAIRQIRHIHRCHCLTDVPLPSSSTIYSL